MMMMTMYDTTLGWMDNGQLELIRQTVSASDYDLHNIKFLVFCIYVSMSFMAGQTTGPIALKFTEL